MTRRLLSFASDHYERCLVRLADTAVPWFDEKQFLYERDIGDEFRKRHARLLSFSRGYGFWIWKAASILAALREMPVNSVLMYVDSQVVFLDDPHPLFELCRDNGGTLFFHQRREGHVNRTFTRRDCFIRMECDAPEFWEGPQLNTAMSVWMPTPEAIGIAEEWYQWCADEQVVSDAPSVLGPELDGFKDHRHDQSILSLMCLKRGLKTFPDPSQFGNGFEEPGRGYGQIVAIDRIVSAPYPIPCRSAS